MDENISRFGQTGHNASMTVIKSSKASNGSRPVVAGT